jgi:hypothetical protein
MTDALKDKDVLVRSLATNVLVKLDPQAAAKAGGVRVKPCIFDSAFTWMFGLASSRAELGAGAPLSALAASEKVLEPKVTGPNDEERGHPRVRSRAPLARSSSSVSSLDFT